MIVPVLIATLNMWRGRGEDITPELGKLGFFAFSLAAILTFLNPVIAIKFMLAFGIIFYFFGTGEMMQAFTGKAQTPKWQTVLIYKLINLIPNCQGRQIGVLYCTILGMFQAIVVSLVNGFSPKYLMFMYSGLIIYWIGLACNKYLGSTAKAWQACEYVLGLFWMIIIIN